MYLNYKIGEKILDKNRWKKGYNLVTKGIKDKVVKKKNRKKTNWMIADTENISKIIWESGVNFMHKSRKGYHVHYHVQLRKYYYYQYLVGGRLMEPFKEPELELDYVKKDGFSYMYVRRVNEKHKDKNGNNDIIEAIIPIFDIWELRMWRYITDGGKEMRAKQIFKFNEWGEIRKDKISRYIKHNFKADLIDMDRKRHDNCQMSAHILRHARAFNLVVTHNIKPYMVISWLGWKNEAMLWYYADIRRSLQIKNQLKTLKESGIKTLDLDKEPEEQEQTVPRIKNSLEIIQPNLSLN